MVARTLHHSDPENEQRVYDGSYRNLRATGNHSCTSMPETPSALYQRNPELGLNAIFEHIAGRLSCISPHLLWKFPDLLIDESVNAVTYPDGTEVASARRTPICIEVVFDYGDWQIPTKDPHRIPRLLDNRTVWPNPSDR